MIDDERLQLETQQLLSDLRRSYTPTPADASRVLAATHRALQAPPPSAARLSGYKLVAAAAVIALGSGAFGYMLGRQDARREPSVAERVAPSPPPAASSAPAPMRAPEVPARSARDLEAALPQASEAEAKSASAHDAVAARAQGKGVVQSSAVSAAARSKRPAPEPSPNSESSPADSLEAELRLLRSVEQALREQRPRHALALLDELDRKVPAGKLGEERLAAFVVARCEIGLGSRAALLREFLGAHADSVYRARVEQACGR